MVKCGTVLRVNQLSGQLLSLVPHEGIGPEGQQRLDGFQVRRSGSPVQRRASVPVARVKHESLNTTQHLIAGSNKKRARKYEVTNEPWRPCGSYLEYIGVATSRGQVAARVSVLNRAKHA